MNTLLYDTPGPATRRRHRRLGAASLLLLSGALTAVILRLAHKGQFDEQMWQPFTDPDILNGIGQGLLATLKAAAAGIALALALAILLAAARLSGHPLVRIPATAVIEFFRAVPLLLLILFLFLGFADEIG
ncbi:ABC transporter permease subunit, partial [Streptomyces sp. 2MCAF27]